MKTNKKNQRVFNSFMEFEKTFLPKSYKQKMYQKHFDAHEPGITLAKKSLDKFKEQLVK